MRLTTDIIEVYGCEHYSRNIFLSRIVGVSGAHVWKVSDKL